METIQTNTLVSISLKLEDENGNLIDESEESLVTKESLEYLPDDVAIGMELDGEEEGVVWIVKSIEDGYATLNANHELAGLTLKASGKVLEMEHLSDEGVQEILNMAHDHVNT